MQIIKTSEVLLSEARIEKQQELLASHICDAIRIPPDDFQLWRESVKTLLLDFKELDKEYLRLDEAKNRAVFIHIKRTLRSKGVPLSDEDNNMDEDSFRVKYYVLWRELTGEYYWPFMRYCDFVDPDNE